MQLSDFDYYCLCFDYCAETGSLIWGDRRDVSDFRTVRGYNVWKSQCVGKLAGGKSSGYRVVGTSRGKALTHRIIWLINKGRWPEGVIDHIDGDPTNNRIENLRDVTQIQNLKNARMKSNNSSGFNGISWCKARDKWLASGSYKDENGKYRTVSIGGFYEIEDAVKARLDWEESVGGFTDRHGK